MKKGVTVNPLIHLEKTQVVVALMLMGVASVCLYGIQRFLLNFIDEKVREYREEWFGCFFIAIIYIYYTVMVFMGGEIFFKSPALATFGILLGLTIGFLIKKYFIDKRMSLSGIPT